MNTPPKQTNWKYIGIVLVFSFLACFLIYQSNQDNWKSFPIIELFKKDSEQPINQKLEIVFPQPGDTIESPVTILSNDMLSEKDVWIRITDTNGNYLKFSHAIFTRKEDGHYSSTLSYSQPNTKQGSIEVFKKQDDLEIDKVTVPVTFSDCLIDVSESFPTEEYIDQEYGFKFNYYPECQLKVNETKASEKENSILYSLSSNFCNFKISISSNPNLLSLNEWVDILQPSEMQITGFIPHDIVMINGLSGYRGVYGCCTNYTPEIFFINQDKTYTFSSNEFFDITLNSHSWFEKEISESKDVFSIIISSFEFID